MTYDTTRSADAETGVADQSTTGQAKERAAEMAGQAQEKVRDVVEDQVDQRSTQAADKVESVAGDVRAVSESLSDRGQDTAARIVEQGADYAQQLSDYLRSSSSDQILDDVAAFARRQPWAVAAAGLVVGFAASRVLRASAASGTDASTTSHVGPEIGTGSWRDRGNGNTAYAVPGPSQMPMSTTTTAPDLNETSYQSASEPLGASVGRPGSDPSSVDGR